MSGRHEHQEEHPRGHGQSHQEQAQPVGGGLENRRYQRESERTRCKQGPAHLLRQKPAQLQRVARMGSDAQLLTLHPVHQFPERAYRDTDLEPPVGEERLGAPHARGAARSPPRDARQRPY